VADAEWRCKHCGATEGLHVTGDAHVTAELNGGTLHGEPDFDAPGDADFTVRIYLCDTCGGETELERVDA
jgi:DNA-directed RNA polymerase subunit RPC12/RpoP